MKLTQTNYHTAKNRYLTNSKIQWFLKDKSFFKKYFIAGEYDYDKTDAMIIGSAVDLIASKGYRTFKRRYKLVARRDSKAPNYEFQLNQTMYDNVVSMWESLSRQDAYRDLDTFDRQVILQVEDKSDNFLGLAGMIDFLKIDHDNKEAIIVDLKTSNNTNPDTYHFKCHDLGYYHQMAMYKSLVRRSGHPDYKVICRHLVLDKDSDGINRCYTFEFNEDTINESIIELYKIIDDIKAEKEFAPNNCSWDNPYLI